MPTTREPDWDSLQAGWPEGAPRLVVGSLREEEAEVRKHFSETHVVVIGSFEGCSCGFDRCVPIEGIEDDDDDDDDDELQVAIESRVALAKYVSEHGVTTLYYCWQAEEGLAARGEVEVSVENLSDRSFELPERMKMRVITK